MPAHDCTISITTVAAQQPALHSPIAISPDPILIHPTDKQERKHVLHPTVCDCVLSGYTQKYGIACTYLGIPIPYRNS